MARYAGTTAQRGLGGYHQADKKRLLALHRDGDLCWRCGQPMYKWQKLDRDHVIDRSLGGASGPAVLAHASCNRRAGARLGNRLQSRTAASAGSNVICRTCGRPYHYSARVCEICGAHYHPSRRDQRSCGRTCGVELQRRNKLARFLALQPISAPTLCACGGIMHRLARCCDNCMAAEMQQAKAARPVQTSACSECGTSCVNKTCGPACAAARKRRMDRERRAVEPRRPQDKVPVRPRKAHCCPGCGRQTPMYRWCDDCLCTDVNAKGKRCGNAARIDGKCDHHAQSHEAFAA